ncbi:MAG: DMT family transporter, partial [Bacteroidales bacterium]|nr:DMT family transporter [Bacteroidales bacterium]
VFALFIVAATICYGININEVKFKLAQLSSLQITSLAFLFTGPIAGVYLLLTDLSPASQTPDYMLNLIYIALLALFSSVIAVLIFNHLIKYTTPLFAASVTYIIPLFAIMWGMIDGESIRLVQLLWIALILMGVYLVNK